MSIESNEQEPGESGAPGIQNLLIKLSEKENLPQGKFLEFNLGENSEELSVYNPSPMIIEEKLYLLARVEDKKSERGSTIKLFTENEKGVWNIVEGWPEIQNAQDPFYCGVINDFNVFGCVNTYDIPGSENQGYRTVFYKYKNSFSEDVKDLEGETPTFAVGPNKMKGIRIVQRANGKIGVFTRPQGDFGGRGSIGYFEISNLDELEDSLTKQAENPDIKTLIEDIFLERLKGENEWGGINEIKVRPDGKMNVLGHIADFGPDGIKKNYFPIAFVFDPETMSVRGLKIVATAEQFPKLEAKLPQLGSVIYSGGLVPLENGLYQLYVGVGDVEAGYIDIEDPFGDME